MVCPYRVTGNAKGIAQGTRTQDYSNRRTSGEKPEGQLFFQQFANMSQAAGLSVNPVDGCQASEEIESPGTTVVVNGTSYPAPQAIYNDMLGTGGANPNLSCFSLGQRRLGN
jgi:hypothetical protein